MGFSLWIRTFPPRVELLNEKCFYLFIYFFTYFNFFFFYCLFFHFIVLTLTYNAKNHHRNFQVGYIVKYSKI